MLVDEATGLDHESVVSCDNATTVPERSCLRRRGSVGPVVAAQIDRAVLLALDLA